MSDETNLSEQSSNEAPAETSGPPTEPAPPPEAPPEAPPPPPPPSVDEIEAQRIEIRKRSANLRKQEREIERTKAEIEQQRRELAELQELKALREKDPYEFAERLGVDWVEVGKRGYERARKVADPVLAEVEAVKQQFAEAEAKRIEEERRKLEEQRAALDDYNMRELKGIFNQLRSETPYLVALLDEGEYTEDQLIGLAYQDFQRVYGETKSQPDPAELFKLYERQAREADERVVQRYQKHTAPKPPPAPPEPPKVPEPKPAVTATRRSVTLSNRDSAAKPPDTSKPATRSERVREAVARFKEANKR